MKNTTQLVEVAMKTPSAIIVVPTYNRNEWLSELLVELCEQIRPYSNIEIMVVDNSPSAAAENICSNFSAAIYLHEPEPGIVAARNRAMEELRVKANRPRYVIFIDDDELPSEHWLKELLHAPEKYDAHAAIGPVSPLLPDTTPALLKKGGFFDRIHLESGTTPPWGTTNNTIIELDVLLSGEERVFDPSFSLTGGSDADLFWRLRAEGRSLVWVEEALVFERFNEARSTWRWISTRNIRLGNVSARLKLRTASKTSVLFLGIARIGFGFGGLLFGLARSRVVDARAHAHLFKGIGMVAEILGQRVMEYERKAGGVDT